MVIKLVRLFVCIFLLLIVGNSQVSGVSAWISRDRMCALLYGRNPGFPGPCDTPHPSPKYPNPTSATDPYFTNNWPLEFRSLDWNKNFIPVTFPEVFPNFMLDTNGKIKQSGGVPYQGFAYADLPLKGYLNIYGYIGGASLRHDIYIQAYPSTDPAPLSIRNSNNLVATTCGMDTNTNSVPMFKQLQVKPGDTIRVYVETIHYQDCSLSSSTRASSWFLSNSSQWHENCTSATNRANGGIPDWTCGGLPYNALEFTQPTYVPDNTPLPQSDAGRPGLEWANFWPPTDGLYPQPAQANRAVNGKGEWTYFHSPADIADGFFGYYPSNLTDSPSDLLAGRWLCGEPYADSRGVMDISRMVRASLANSFDADGFYAKPLVSVHCYEDLTDPREINMDSNYSDFALAFVLDAAPIPSYVGTVGGDVYSKINSSGTGYALQYDTLYNDKQTSASTLKYSSTNLICTQNDLVDVGPPSKSIIVSKFNNPSTDTYNDIASLYKMELASYQQRSAFPAPFTKLTDYLQRLTEKNSQFQNSELRRLTGSCTDSKTRRVFAYPNNSTVTINGTVDLDIVRLLKNGTYRYDKYLDPTLPDPPAVSYVQTDDCSIGDAVIKFSGNLIISTPPYPNSYTITDNAIIFVAGNLTINSPILKPPGNNTHSIIFVVSGNIIIGEGQSPSKQNQLQFRASPPGIDEIDAGLITDKNIIINDDTKKSSYGVKDRLVINGLLIQSDAAIANAVFDRTINSYHVIRKGWPSEEVIYDPSIFFNLGSELGEFYNVQVTEVNN